MSCCDGGKKQASQPEPNLNWNNNQRQQQVKNSFKVVFLGKSGVGKTSITLRFCRDTFQDGAEATIGASFLTKMMTVNDRTIKFEMWDTAGQENKALAPMYYRNADAAVLVYDITDSESFEALQSWYQELQKNVPDCIIFLAGNKSDLKDKRKVTNNQANDFARDKDCPLKEVSSKTGEGIPELFNTLGTSLITKFPG